MLGTEIRIKGKVQGVGFRPYIWQIAHDLAIHGEVLNDGEGVLVRLADTPLIEQFHLLLFDRCPPLARIDSVSSSPYQWPKQPATFDIVNSEQAAMNTHVVPDAATCPDCLAELNDTSDRRYQYPFLNCTHCGPRFTIIKAMPYDRPATVMADFPFCPDCLAEYQHPADRRFHAQPVACPACGPQVWVTDNTGEVVTGDWLSVVEQAINAGQVVAIKSVGGFHLVCDATNDRAVSLLRERKQRPSKPLAVMVKNSKAVEELALCNEKEREVLESPAAPIVLLNKREGSSISELIAPQLTEIGVMLPSNPLQHLVMARLGRPLVMTSGNGSGLPPALSNRQALAELASLADLFVLHNRDIVQRSDDSLVRVRQSGKLETLRRARGYAPDPLTLPDGFPCADGYIAYGGDLKASFAVGRGNEVVLSQYLGDLSNLETQQQYRAAIAHFESVYQLELKQHVIDCHPGYYSHQYGLSRAKQVRMVAHHHAHVAACLVENGWQPSQGKVIALALDGLGMSEDGELWGGELLVADYQQCEKLGGLPAVALPGGDKAAKEPWRVYYSHLKAFMPDLAQLPLDDWFKGKSVSLLDTAINRKINSPLISSAGRLFDAVAASLGICFDKIDYEGQAACILESMASEVKDKEINLDLVIEVEGYNLKLNSFWPQWLNLKADPKIKAYLFHRALARALSLIAIKCANHYQLNTLVLTGGVFHNALLTELIKAFISERVRILEHTAYSFGDGSLALGQLAVAVNKN